MTANQLAVSLLRHAGMTTRIDGGAFHTVDVLELDLSGR